MITPDDIIHRQIDLLLKMDDPTFRQILYNTIAAANPESAASMRHIPNIVRNAVESSEPYRVHHDVTELIQVAAAAYHDDDVFHIDSVPTPCGIVRFEQPIKLHDARGNDMLAHWLVWGPVTAQVAKANGSGEPPENRSSIVVTFWNDIDVEPDFYAQEMLREHGDEYRSMVGAWSIIGTTLILDRMKIGPVAMNMNETARIETYTNTFRIITALFDLLQETIVVSSSEQVTRATRKRAARYKMQTSGVRVVSLPRREYERRARAETAESEGKQYNCRWVVRGHWHRYRVGAGRERVVRRWVNSYVKGPEDKPLQPRISVYDLRVPKR